jgi:hypothetical protein
LNEAGREIRDDYKIVEEKLVEEWNEIRSVVMNACKCTNYNCGCCAHLEEKDIHLNSTSKTVMLMEEMFYLSGSCCVLTLHYSYALFSVKKLNNVPSV